MLLLCQPILNPCVLDHNPRSITGDATLGTPGYIADEVMSGKFGVASDIFSLGVVLLELLTGRRALGMVEKIRDTIEDDGRKAFLKTFSAEWADQTAGWGDGESLNLLRDLALKCVERRSKKRPQSAMEVLMALRAVEEAWAAEHRVAEEEPVAAVVGGISIEQYHALQVQLEAARQALHAQEEAAAAAAAAAAEDTATCVISFEECPASNG